MQDANLDVAKQVAAAEDFIAKGVDVLIITPVNEEGVVPLLRQAKAANIPVVLEGNPVKGMTTMVAICDYDTGYFIRRRSRQIRQGEARRRRQGDECRPAAAVGHGAALAGLHGWHQDRDPRRHDGPRPRRRRQSGPRARSVVGRARQERRHQHHLRHQRFLVAGRPAGLEGGRQVAGRPADRRHRRRRPGLHQRHAERNRPTASRRRCSRRRTASPRSTRP